MGITGKGYPRKESSPTKNCLHYSDREINHLSPFPFEIFLFDLKEKKKKKEKINSFQKKKNLPWFVYLARDSISL